MKIEEIPITEITLDKDNARTHSERNIKAIEGSLTRFGQRKPIVLTQGKVVVAGNGTLTAARNLGWDKIQAVFIPASWTTEEIKAFALADNRTAELAEWNQVRLAEQLLELETLDFDIKEIGFDTPEATKAKELSEFPVFDDDEATTHKCPKCQYEWNGASR